MFYQDGQRYNAEEELSTYKQTESGTLSVKPWCCSTVSDDVENDSFPLAPVSGGSFTVQDVQHETFPDKHVVL